MVWPRNCQVRFLRIRVLGFWLHGLWVVGFRVWGLGPRLSLEDNLSSWRTATRFLLLHPKPETFNGTEKKDAPPGCEFTVLDWGGQEH